ncbi:MAG TPA: DNA polymerase III subunit delta [Candidatus Humimicrobiaceae bacterium]|nr:DNA polymerase III subunit delta [Candidatus Humimicrobiaceae bacterium]
MIIFLYGQDSYRSHQKLKEIIEYYKKIHKGGLDLRYFDDENLNFQEFKNDIETYSIFREKKLIVLKGVFDDKDFQEEFLKQRKKFINSDNTILIYEKKELEKNNPFLEFLKKKSKSQEFQPLEGQRLKNWVKKELKDYQASCRQKTDIGQIKIEEKALDRLMYFVGNNLWQMSNEVKKLANYKNKGVIKIEDVELLVRPEIELDIFKTIDAMALRDKKQALGLLRKHLEKGDAPLYLLAMINFQLRNLLTIKSGAKLSAHPYVVRKTIQQARNFSLGELKKIYQKIFQADLDIKTGKIEPEAALDLLVAEI